MQVAAITESKSLFEKLQETYRTEIIQPYGKVLIIPNKAFKPKWRQELENEGLKIYCSNYGSQAAFFIKMKEHDSSIIEESSAQKPEADSKPSPAKLKVGLWTLEERKLVDMLHAKGMSVTEIGHELQRSPFSIAAQLSHLSIKRRQRKKPEKVETTTSELEDPDPDVVRELLESALLLYDSGKKRACKLVLAEANKELRRS